MKTFPFPSLDFPGRTTVTVSEIAEKLGYDRKHVQNWIEDGSLFVFDGKREGRTKSSIRVPLECYRAFVIQRMSADADTAKNFIARAEDIINEQLSLELK